MIYSKRYWATAVCFITQVAYSAELSLENSKAPSVYASAVLESSLEQLANQIDQAEKLPEYIKCFVGQELIAQQQDIFNEFDGITVFTTTKPIDIFAFDFYGAIYIVVEKKSDGSSVLFHNTTSGKKVYFNTDEPVRAVVCNQNETFHVFFRNSIELFYVEEKKRGGNTNIQFDGSLCFFCLSSSGKHFFTIDTSKGAALNWASVTDPGHAAIRVTTEHPSCADVDMRGDHAFICSDTSLLLANRNSLDFKRTIPFDRPLTHGRINASGTIVVLTTKTDLYCVDFVSGTIMRVFTDLRSPVSSLGLTGLSGQYALIGNQAGNVLMWDTKANRLSTYAVLKNPILQLAISGNGKSVAIVNEEHKIRLIDHCKKAEQFDLKTLILLAKVRQFSLKMLLENQYLAKAYKSLKVSKPEDSLYELHKKALTILEATYTQCTICQEKNANCGIKNECEHTFCHECLLKIIDAVAPCPLCRKEIRAFFFQGNLNIVSYKASVE